MTDLYTLFQMPLWISALVTVLVGMLLLYLGRSVMHQLIQHTFKMLYSSLRLGARSVVLAEERLRARNRDVLLSLGRVQVERDLEREFFRIHQFVERDLGGYPKLQRSVQELITRIDEDYRLSAEVPSPSPESPEWIQAVELVAKLHLKEKGNDLTARILEDIYHGSEQQHADALKDYRQSISERHGLLKRMAPYWRKLAHRVDQIGDHLQEVIRRAKHIDEQLDQYYKIMSSGDEVARALTASALTQFSVAMLAVLIAVGGAFFNFDLIALSVADLVGEERQTVHIKTADLWAAVIVMLHMVMGIFLMEGLRVTHLFPSVAALDHRTRKMLVWSLTILLLLLAIAEANLAYMREPVSVDPFTVDVDDYTTSSEDAHMPLLANMAMGFVLPLALVFFAIPLEYLIRTGRTVLGILLEFLLRLIAVSLRLTGNMSRHLSKIVTNVYDLSIIVPLWLETWWLQKKQIDDTVSLDYESAGVNKVQIDKDQPSSEQDKQ